ncbi:hypothetical protein Tco_0780709 [Tanacetum coccineum]
MSLRAFHKPEILRISAEQLIIVAAMAKVTGLDQQKTETTDRVSHIKAGYEVEEDVVDSNLVQIGFRHVLLHFLSFSYIRVTDHLLTTEVSLNDDDENEKSMTWLRYHFDMQP